MNTKPATYPNPLNINFGEGRIIIAKWNDAEARGVVFMDSGKPNQIGADCGLPPVSEHIPQEGEIYIRFKNVESARVLHEILAEVIAEWPHPIES